MLDVMNELLLQRVSGLYCFDIPCAFSREIGLPNNGSCVAVSEILRTSSSDPLANRSVTPQKHWGSQTLPVC